MKRAPPCISMVHVSAPIEIEAPSNGAWIVAVAASRVMFRIGDFCQVENSVSWQSAQASEPA